MDYDEEKPDAKKKKGNQTEEEVQAEVAVAASPKKRRRKGNIYIDAGAGEAAVTFELLNSQYCNL